jgi:hypothetical protein
MYNKLIILVSEAVFWCRRRADTGVSSRRPGFDTGLFRMKFLVEKMALGGASTSYWIFSVVIFILIFLHHDGKAGEAQERSNDGTIF